MQTKKLLTALGTVAIVAIFLVPATMAQAPAGQPQVQLTKSTYTAENLKPEIGSGKVNLEFDYIIPNTATSIGGTANGIATATVLVTCTDRTNVIITGPQTINFLVAPGQDTKFPFKADFNVAVTRDLPGLKKVTCDWTAEVAEVQANSLPASGQAKGNFQVSAAFFSLVQAKVPTQIKEAGPQKEVSFEITLDNFGNARTQIQFAVDERPGGAKWQAVLPDDVILDSPSGAGGKTTDTAIFTIQTPHKNGWNNEQGTYRLRMKTFAADDPEQTGLDLTTNMLVRVRGVYVPTLEPMIMVGAVIGAAALARVMRQE